MVSSVLKLLFAFLPAPAAVFALGIIAAGIIVIVFKLVKLVLDAIPFL